MIVILSNKEDENSSLLVKYLFSNSIEYNWVFPNCVQSVYNDHTGYTYIRLIDGSIIDNINNIFINRLPALPPQHPLIMFLYMIPYNMVLTHPNIASTLFSKLSQLKYFKLFPDTMVLKSINNISLNNTCVKSMSQTRSFVRESKDLELINNEYNYMPVQFQRVLYGSHIKSHIIGGDVYSYCFQAKTLDPRESDYILRSYPSTSFIKNSMSIIASKIGINYFDCDIIVTNNKSVVFLEINSSPAPLVFAKESKNHEVTSRFIDFLIKHEYKVSI